MPLGAVQVIAELVDYDEGDEVAAENAVVLSGYVRDRLTRLSFADKNKGIDVLKMSFQNDDGQLLEMPAFTKGQKLMVSWGVIGEMAGPCRAVVVKTEGSNPMVVVLHGTVMLMNKEKRYRFMEGFTDSEFVRAVAAEYGYKGSCAVIEETTVRHDITQVQSWTDAKMLARLARRNGFEFYVDGMTLHWHKRNTEAGVVRHYFYRSDLGVGDIVDAPHLQSDLARPTAMVKVLARDPDTKELVEAVGGPDTDMTSLGAEDEVGNPDTDMGRREGRLARVDIRHGGLMTEAEAKVEADARYRETAKDKHKIEMGVRGHDDVVAGVLVGLWNYSDPFDGLYYVQECEHLIEDGKFVQRLKLEKDALAVVPAAKKQRKKKVNATIEQPTEEVAEPYWKRYILEPLDVLVLGSDGKEEVVQAWTDKEGTPYLLEGEQATTGDAAFPDESNPRYDDFIYSLREKQSIPDWPDATQ